MMKSQVTLNGPRKHVQMWSHAICPSQAAEVSLETDSPPLCSAVVLLGSLRMGVPPHAVQDIL